MVHHKDCIISPATNYLRALAFGHAKKKKKKKKIAFGYAKKKKKSILHPQTLLYLFYQFILQLTLHPNFYFYIQLNKKNMN